MNAFSNPWPLPALLATVVAGLVLQSPAAELPAYRLDIVRGDGTYYPRYILGINNPGQLAGQVQHLGPRPNDYSTVVITDGVPRVLVEAEGPGGAFADMNDAGDVVGKADYQPYSVWWHDGTVEPLPDLGSANAINTKGQIAGNGPNGYAVRYDHGEILQLEGFDQGYTVAEAINEHGSTAGSVGLWPAVWDEAGRVTVLDAFGELGGSARAINDFGHAVGYTLHRPPRDGAFFYDGSRMIRVPRPGRCLMEQATRINNRDLVLGQTRCGGEPGPVLWQGGLSRYLRDLLPDRARGWKTLYARDLNDAGQIVGWGSYYGKDRSFIASPVAVDRVQISPLMQGRNGTGPEQFRHGLPASATRRAASAPDHRPGATAR